MRATEQEFAGRVAIVTGAGGGLGRLYALALAAGGAKVVVNDLGGSLGGAGASTSYAEQVAEEIRAFDGEAVADASSVTDFSAVQLMIKRAADKWGRVDIVVNNAGILRDKSFAKMEVDDFRTVVDVHLMGAVHCCKAAWPLMVNQSYGRIMLTTSAAGLYGNFGQSNYGAAKLALVGLMQTLSIEGAKSDIRVNSLAPTAVTRMTEAVFPPEMREAFRPEAVVPGMLHLVGEDAPKGVVLCAGAGSYEAAHITLTKGVHVGDGNHARGYLRARWAEVMDRVGERVPKNAFAQGENEMDLRRRSGTRG
jgi:NAD(P)-dependent dehydrogenase (short-subunit alcohol dehydrogenase family)